MKHTLDNDLMTSVTSDGSSTAHVSRFSLGCDLPCDDYLDEALTLEEWELMKDDFS